MSSNLKNTCIDKNELVYFNKLSSEWWNNPQLQLLRNAPGLFVPYISSNVEECFPNKPLESLRILEVGCGGGFLSEELSRAGYNLVAIDVSEDLLEIAKAHAELDPTLPKIKYLLEPIEEHCKLNFKQYDVVISNFVLEHVSDHDYFIKCCSDCVKPGGLLFMSAIAKTFLSWLFSIFIPENILGLVPKGMHHYDKCIRALDTERIIESYNFKVKITRGLLYNPFKSEAFFFPTNTFAYIVCAVCNRE